MKYLLLLSSLVLAASCTSQTPREVASVKLHNPEISIDCTAQFKSGSHQYCQIKSKSDSANCSVYDAKNPTAIGITFQVVDATPQKGRFIKASSKSGASVEIEATSEGTFNSTNRKSLSDGTQVQCNSENWD